MDTFEVKHLTFTYPGKNDPALKDICLNIQKGQFVVLCGKSGCGKSTLLRQLKETLAPHGQKSGEILFEGRPLDSVGHREQSEKIGFVLQSPDNQIVTDKVWHELAFGLESLGYGTSEIRARVSEMASFFGIQTWFHKKVSELSGGQKQLLNLASVMAMQPSVLIIDEPTSQLDPIAASEFLETVRKINCELGTTVLLAEHRLEEALPMSDRVIVMEDGAVIADGTPQQAGESLKEQNRDMFVAMPTPMRVYAGVENELNCPVTVRDGRMWLEQVAQSRALDESAIPKERFCGMKKEQIELNEVWFRYGRELPDVLKGLCAKIYEGELFAIVGGNGTGKTTSLSVISGLFTPYRGEVKIGGKKISDIAPEDRFNGLFGVLPQNPQTLFVKKTVELDLYEIFNGRKIPKQEQDRCVAEVSELCELEDLLLMHPYDLSGGEQQRAALAKVLLLRPRILLLDEPTKGIDSYFKRKLAGIIKQLQSVGTTIVMVSHDIEFCARYADRCAMFFDGGITSCIPPRSFFAGKSFYTTAANRMARSLLQTAVLDEDIIIACGGKVSDQLTLPTTLEPNNDIFIDKKAPKSEQNKIQITPKRIVFAGMFFLLFLLTACFFSNKWTDWRDYLVQFTLVLEMALALVWVFPGKPLGTPDFTVQTPKEKRKLSKRTLTAMAMILFAIPLTICIGIVFLGDKKYYFISMLIILETLLPFVMIFESRRPQARELIVIASLCALGVAGRTAFFMLPQFKPVVALVILSGVCFGGEAGFLVGAITGFVSNMFFGQGPWTPWQMFAFGIIGFLAGLLFRKGLLRKRQNSLCIFGGLATFFFYGGIMNPASVLMWQAKPTAGMFVSAYLMGIPFDLIHAASTVFFLWFISGAMIEKLDRIKVKYGLIES